MNGILERIVALEYRLAEAERRARNRRRTGTVTEVDLKKGLARVKLLDSAGKPFIGPWAPWKEIAAGGISSHIPPTVGQQVDLLSESGDLTDAVIDFSTHSNANPRPHDGPEAVVKYGATRITIADGSVEIRSDVTIKGKLRVEGAVTLTGPSATHNGKNIGEDHRHTDAMPGTGLTGIPNSA